MSCKLKKMGLVSLFPFGFKIRRQDLADSVPFVAAFIESLLTRKKGLVMLIELHTAPFYSYSDLTSMAI